MCLLVFWSNKMQGLDCSWFGSRSKMTRPSLPCTTVMLNLEWAGCSREAPSVASFCSAASTSRCRCGTPAARKPFYVKLTSHDSSLAKTRHCKTMLHLKNIETLNQTDKMLCSLCCWTESIFLPISLIWREETWHWKSWKHSNIHFHLERQLATTKLRANARWKSLCAF